MSNKKRMKLSLPKLRAIILYFTNNTNTKYLGKVKLMKLFYYLDFKHVKKFGAPVTYDTYVNMEYGPVPSFIKNMVDYASEDLENSPLNDIVKFETPKKTQMRKVLPRRKFTEDDKGLFTSTELEMLATVSKLFGNMKTEKIKELSHKEAPWRETEYLEEIPYTLAALDDDCEVKTEEIDLLLNL